LLCFVIFVQDFSGDAFLLPSLNSVLKTDFFIVLSILRRKKHKRDVQIYLFLSEKQVFVLV